MEVKYTTGAHNASGSQRDSNLMPFLQPGAQSPGLLAQDADVESAVLYKQISYEELEECVFIVRDSISDFYLAPQGEISFAAVEAAVEAAIKAKSGDGRQPSKHVAPQPPALRFSIDAVPRLLGESIFQPFGNIKALRQVDDAGAVQQYRDADALRQYLDADEFRQYLDGDALEQYQGMDPMPRPGAVTAGIGAVSAENRGSGSAVGVPVGNGDADNRAAEGHAQLIGITGGSGSDGGGGSGGNSGNGGGGGGSSGGSGIAGGSGNTVGGGNSVGGAGNNIGGIGNDSGSGYNPGENDSGAGSSKGWTVNRRVYQPHTIPIHQIYRESIKKRGRKRRASTFKYLAASFCGTVFGGLLMMLCVTLFLPSLGFRLFSQPPDNVHEVIHTYEYAKADTQIEAIYEKVSPSVVGIRVTASYDDYIFGQQQGSGDGSGIIIHSDGFILTNNHVVTAALPSYVPFSGRGGPQAEVSLEVVIQRDPGTVYKARLVARDTKTDIAVLKIEASNLPVADLGDSDELKHGEMVIAIGRPAGMDNICSVTDGIVSGFNSSVNTGADMEANLIQTSAVINYGNSGGALVNSKGQVVGINVITTDSLGNPGLSFAIPINSARSVADSLIDFNYVRGRAKTGIGYSESYNDNYENYERQNPGIPKGVYVDYVEPLSGAFIAGIRVGDVITKMRGEAITDYTEMLKLNDTLTPGDIIEVEVFRAGEYINMMLEVSEEIGDDQENY